MLRPNAILPSVTRSDAFPNLLTPMKNAASRVYILSSDKTSRLYTAWLSQLNLPFEFVEGWDENWQPPADAGLVLTHLHYTYREVAILSRALQENRVPLLVLADGVLEFRNTFEHPALAPGAIFQPLMAHKLACVGRSQARIVESWNRPGVCEVVGLPYLDKVTSPVKARDRQDNEFRLMIATARTPGFTHAQLGLTIQALRDVKQWLANQQHTGRLKIRPIWRLTFELAQDISVDPTIDEISSGDLTGQLNNTDAVITTPSTVALEAALFQIPVAVLDYTNSPSYVPAAWTITAAQHISQIIRQLIQPSAARMLFQQTVLFDALECSSSAAPRMVKLVESMVQIGQRCRAEGVSLHFPHRILDSSDYNSNRNPIAYDLAELYPRFPQISIRDSSRDTVLATHRDVELKRMEQEIFEQSELITSQRQEIRRLEISAQNSSEFVSYRNELFARIDRAKVARTQWASRIKSDLLVVEALNRLLRFREALSKSPTSFVRSISASRDSTQKRIRTRARQSIRISPRWRASGVVSYLRSCRKKMPADKCRLRLYRSLIFESAKPKIPARKKLRRRLPF